MKTFAVAFFLAVIGAAALISGRYTSVASQQSSSAILFVTDRFTGDVTICGIAGCRPLQVVEEEVQ